MAIIIDMSNCPCCVCCPRAYAGLPSLHVLTVFNWSDGNYQMNFNANFDAGQQKWIGEAECNGQTFLLKFWCNEVANGSYSANQWLFSLISGGVDYANPITQSPGGATLILCNPFFLFAQITAGYYGDDFPFCDKGGTFPSGQFMSAFQLSVTE